MFFAQLTDDIKQNLGMQNDSNNCNDNISQKKAQIRDYLRRLQRFVKEGDAIFKNTGFSMYRLFDHIDEEYLKETNVKTEFIDQINDHLDSIKAEENRQYWDCELSQEMTEFIEKDALCIQGEANIKRGYIIDNRVDMKQSQMNNWQFNVK